MKIIYFLAKPNGYQVRCTSFNSLKDQALKTINVVEGKADLAREKALAYAQNWIKHNPSSENCYMINDCFLSIDIAEFHAVKVLICAICDSKIYPVNEKQGDYSPYSELIAHILNQEKGINAFVQVLNSKGDNVWLYLLLEKCAVIRNKQLKAKFFHNNWK